MKVRVYNGLEYQYRVVDSGAQIINRIQAQAAQVGAETRGTLQVRPGVFHNSLVLKGSYTPRWAIFMAIFFFPLGMLALVSTTHLELNISAWTDASGVTVVTIYGECEDRVSGSILELLAASASNHV